jgi:UDP-N-acetyl-2-amino-2-deoxyglucuronate dehydrogenase
MTDHSTPPGKFALIGAAGYIAPRHMQAIKDVGGDLIAALDPKDSVGIIDRYFPDASFFVEFERFDRYIDKLRRRGEPVDYVSICSPNYLHDAHVRFALRSHADAICEKPLVLAPWNVDGLAEIERESGRRINTILQLRLHPAIIRLHQQYTAAPASRRHRVDLTYVASRGRWYGVSWKGDEGKSGGIAANIGIHFFDMLVHLFGPARKNLVHLREASRAGGYLELERADVRWFLSVDRADLPSSCPPGKSTHRAISIDGEEVEFSGGFEDLHTLSYRAILAGNGFTLQDARPAVEITSAIRFMQLTPHAGDVHPKLRAVGS